MNNLMNLLSKYNDKVLRVFCRPSFVNFIIGMRTPTQERPTQVGNYPMVEVEMREEYRLELTDGRVVHQDGSIDDSVYAQQAVYRELVTLGLRINTNV